MRRGGNPGLCRHNGAKARGLVPENLSPPLKKSATIISQQYNRFLPNAGVNADAGTEAAIRALTAAVAPGKAELRELFGGPEQGEGET